MVGDWEKFRSQEFVVIHITVSASLVPILTNGEKSLVNYLILFVPQVLVCNYLVCDIVNIINNISEK